MCFKAKYKVINTKQQLFTDHFDQCLKSIVKKTTQRKIFSFAHETKNARA